MSALDQHKRAWTLQLRRPKVIVALTLGGTAFTLLLLAPGAGWDAPELLLVIIAAFGGGLVGFAAASATLRLPRLEDYVQVINLYEARQEHAHALQWVRRALEQHPRHVGLSLKEAEFLLHMGLEEQALTRLRGATERCEDGWAAFRSAQILDEAGYDVERVEEYLQTAFRKSPWLARELRPGQFTRVDTPRLLRTVGIDEGLLKNWGDGPSAPPRRQPW